MDTQAEQIDKILKLTENTNRIVHSMRNQHRMASFARVLYLIAFAWLSWWGYLQLQPYLAQLEQTYAQINALNKTTQEVSQQVKASSNIDVQQLLDKLHK